jgi:glycosyltransferase involved in cell wall biosynthesis
MKFQILIPHYKEKIEEITPLLDSIAIQQNVDFNEIGVIICNDGTDVRLNFKDYPFKIDFFEEPHRGVSGTRNACLDHATADYVMFCDADDMFCHVCGLYIIFREIDNGGFDSLISVFM